MWNSNKHLAYVSLEFQRQLGKKKGFFFVKTRNLPNFMKHKVFIYIRSLLTQTKEFYLIKK